MEMEMQIEEKHENCHHYITDKSINSLSWSPQWKS